MRFASHEKIDGRRRNVDTFVKPSQVFMHIERPTALQICVSQFALDTGRMNYVAIIACEELHAPGAQIALILIGDKSLLEIVAVENDLVGENGGVFDCHRAALCEISASWRARHRRAR